ncbi:MAG: hypothetical protein WBQ76_11030 [Candidatus Korobacteraceae bacterium]
MRYWISYDLGLRGNYDQLYAWLDKHSARECGDSVATFLSKKTRAEIVKELAAVFDLSGAQRPSALSALFGETPTAQGPRIYIITMKEGGKFVFGRRKPAPWTGYAQVLDSGEERDE